MTKSVKTIVTAAALMGLAANAQAILLSGNLDRAVTSSEDVTTTRFVTDSFGTDGFSGALSSVTLLMRDAGGGGGTAQVDIYTSVPGGGSVQGQPGTLVGTLTSPGSISTSFANTTFTASGIDLASGTTYWVVLRALSGFFQWDWTSDNSGDGPGFQHTWGFSSNTGATWATFDTEPMQMQVDATAPEPASIALLGLGLAAFGFRRRSRG